MYIKVKATPESKKEKAEEVSSDTWKIAVREKAEMNQANKRLKVILADIYKCTPKQVKIVSGHRSPSKIFSVPDVQIKKN